MKQTGRGRCCKPPPPPNIFFNFPKTPPCELHEGCGTIRACSGHMVLDDERKDNAMKTNKYDVYETDDGKFLVYERGEVPDYGEMPEGTPLYTAETMDEWHDWCDEHVGQYEDDSIRVMKSVCTVPAAYLADLKRKAQETLDRYRQRGKECGWGELTIDKSWTIHIFRVSADWKNMPTLYTFDQRLKWSNSDGRNFNDTDHLWARDEYVRLVGMADAAHELGFDIVFTEDFKIEVEGVWKTWHGEYDN